MQRAPLVVVAVTVAAGIALGLIRPAPSWSGPLLLPVAALGALLALSHCVLQKPRPSAPGWLLGLVLLAGLMLGVTTRANSDASCVHSLPEGRPVTVTGTVMSSSAAQVRIRIDSLRLGQATVPCGAEVPARHRRTRDTPAAEVPVGSVVVGVGRWWSPPMAERQILRRPGALLFDDLDIVVLARRVSLAERIRRGARARVDRLFGAQAPLAASLLLAQRDALDPEVRDRFARAGLSHLLAISGLHVGLVCGMLLLMGSLSRMGKRGSAVLAAVGTVGYVLLLGAPHSASRAALQLVFLLAATMIQRPTRPEAMVAAAALILLAADPGALLSPGFQLSFAGVVGLLVLRPPLVAVLAGRGAGGRLARARRWLGDAVATSLAATLSTAPIVAWHFGHVAPIGIVANLVAIPLLSLALPALALALLVGAGASGIGTFLAGPGAVALAALDRVAATAAAVPGATIPVHGSTGLVLTVALTAGYLASRRLGGVRPLIRGAAWSAVAAMVLIAAPVRPVGDRIEVHVLDVGQGDAIAVRSPAGRWLVVDAGMAGRDFDAGARRVVPYLLRRGGRRIEGLVLTHPHADHTGGGAAVIRQLRPRWVGDPGSPAPSAQYLGLLRVAHGARLSWVGLRQGSGLALDGVMVDFLHPEIVGATEGDANDLSVVVRVRYGDFAALLTGDATALVEERLVRYYGGDLRADVLKVGHHGSRTSSTTAFLEAAGARIALISAGHGNRYGHPHRDVLDRLEAHGIKVLRTDRHGSIVVRADGRGGVWVEAERGAVP